MSGARPDLQIRKSGSKRVSITGQRCRTSAVLISIRVNRSIEGGKLRRRRRRTRRKTGREKRGLFTCALVEWRNLQAEENSEEGLSIDRELTYVDEALGVSSLILRAQKSQRHAYLDL